MSGLEVAAGGFAVASLAIQASDAIERIHRFWCSIRDAPQEVGQIRDDLAVLQAILSSIADAHQQQSGEAFVERTAAIKALEGCGRRVQSLQEIVERLQTGLAAGGRQRRWTALKSAWQKRAIVETLDLLESAKTTLLLANQFLFQYVLDHRLSTHGTLIHLLTISAKLNITISSC